MKLFTNWRCKLSTAALVAGLLSPVAHAKSDNEAKETEPIEKTVVQDKSEVSKQAFELLRTRCFQCHGEQLQHEKMDVLDRESLIAKYLTPGDPKDSAIWDAISDNRMPKGASSEPESRNRPLSLEEKDVIKKWIQQGAEFPARKRLERKDFITREMVLTGVSKFLERQPAARRQLFKFFSLANVYNNAAFSDDDVAVRRSALSKLLNSISRNSEIVLPESVPGTEETVYAVNWKDDLLLDLADFRTILEHYPFGLKYSSGAFEEAGQLQDNLEKLIEPPTERDGIRIIRADWFIANASRPPLYHALAGIPENFSGIESELNINVADNFAKDLSKRISIQRSGVSKQNRMLEWHTSRSRRGTLWVSYDFGSNVGKATIEIRPLGPKQFGSGDKVKENVEFKDFAFEHDGGEIIYPRANGLHGYMLVDNKGKRIDAGPVNIVSDASEASGTPQIVNGVSCMHCHRQGMLSKYEAAPDSAVIGNSIAKTKVNQMFVNEKAAETQFKNDRRDYMDALSKAIGPFVIPNYTELTRDQVIKVLERLDDPVSIVARQYRSDLGVRQVALELDWEDGVGALTEKLDDSGLKQLGVGPLVRKEGPRSRKFRSGGIKRELWDDREISSESLYQTVARKLQIGTPINHAKSSK